MDKINKYDIRRVAVEHIDDIKKKFSVCWMIGRRCNYNCSYCGINNHDKTSKALPLDIAEKTIKKISDTAKKQKRTISEIIITGGEPLLNPDFIEILKIIKRYNIKVGDITSNGSAPIGKYLRIMEYCHLSVSYHFESVNHQYFIKLIEAVKKIENYKKKFTVKFMFLPGKLKETKEMIKFFKINNIKFVIKRIHPQYTKKGIINRPYKSGAEAFYPYGNAKTLEPGFIKDSRPYYNKEEIKFLNSIRMASYNNIIVYYEDLRGNIIPKKTNVNDILGNLEQNFKGWKCWIGPQFLFINYNGDVFRSWCQMREKKLGNVYEDFLMPNDPIICKSQACNCGLNIGVSKALHGKVSLLKSI